MRKTRELQSTIFDIFPNHAFGIEYQAISQLLDQHPRFLLWVAKDLGIPSSQPTGRPGLSAETILRACIVMKQHQMTFQDLAIQICDSATFRAFCRVGHHDPSKSALQDGISRIRAQTWEKINRGLLASAMVEGVEKGRMVRIDATPIESPIHQPTDSSLLGDGIRVMVRLLKLAQSHFPKVGFCDRSRATKKRVAILFYQRKKADRKAIYKDLLNYASETLVYLNSARNTVPTAEDEWGKWHAQASRIATLIEEVISQTRNRVIEGLVVSAQDKVVSLFEDHSDIIVKGRRNISYGHKVTLAAGQSGMILDLVVEEGNPADSQCAQPMIQRQIDIYCRPPRQCAFDGGYASLANLNAIKALGVKDVMFHKKRGLKVEAMTKSKWVYRKLHRFRAGVESVISCMKRVYGWTRCTWKSLDRFKAYVWSSTVAFNLAHLGRKLVALKT
jgi:IS5 family transposase